MLHLARWAKLLSWLDVARVFKTSWDSVYDSVDRVVAYGLEHRNLDGVTSLGVDEIAQGKGHKYLTLVYQITFGKIRLLWIGQGRKITEFNKFFDLLGPERCAKLQFICSDMWPAYLNVIAKRCVNALNILDKFHIVAKLNQAIDTVRRQETRKLRELGKKPFLKHMRWCVLKLKINLTAKEKAKLSGALNNSVTANLQTFKSYLMGQTFQQFWTYTSVTWARKFLRQWTKMVMLSKIEPMKKVARTLQNHEELILNYFRARKEFSSGVVEGLNNKAKTAMRRSYGLKTFKVTEAVLYHTLGQLPEPDIGRKFY
jgi:transposase